MRRVARTSCSYSTRIYEVFSVVYGVSVKIYITTVVDIFSASLNPMEGFYKGLGGVDLEADGTICVKNSQSMNRDGGSVPRNSPLKEEWISAFPCRAIFAEHIVYMRWILLHNTNTLLREKDPMLQYMSFVHRTQNYYSNSCHLHAVRRSVASNQQTRAGAVVRCT